MTEIHVNDQMIDDMMAKYGYTWDEPNMQYVNGSKTVNGDFASDFCKAINNSTLVTRFELIDHRECFWCRGRKTANYAQKDGDYKEQPCDKCEGSGIMGGRIYSVFDIKAKLSYQDDDRTLKVFINDKDKL